MPDLLLGPVTAENAAEVILRPNLPGAVDQPLLNGSGAGPGIHLMPGFRFPVIVNEHRFTESSFTEGRKRTGTRPQNATGGGEVRFEGAEQGEFWGYIDDFQQTIAAINRVVGGVPVGGELEVTLTGGQTITFEIESADLAEPTNLDRFMAQEHAIFGFTFEVAPYGLLDAVELLDAPIVSTDPVVSVPIETVPGQVEALTTITVEDSDGQSRDQVEYGVEENVDLADLPPLAIEAADLVELSGSLAGSVIEGDVGAVAVALCSTGIQSHQGRRKIKVHIEADTADTWVWLEYRIGDGPWTGKPPQRCLTGAVCERELGAIVIPAGKTWEGRIVVMCEEDGTVEVTRVEPFPAAWYGVARRELDIETPTTFTAYDGFDQTAGDLDGKTLPAGGAWVRAGDADDWDIDTDGHRARRMGVSGVDTAGVQNGCFEIAGTTTLTLGIVTAELRASGWLTDQDQQLGVVARYTDTDNFIIATLVAEGGEFFYRLTKRVLATSTVLAQSPANLANAALYETRLYIDEAGRAVLVVNGAVVLSVVDSSLASGGDIDSGKVGIYSHQPDTDSDGSTPFQYADNVAAWIPEGDAACFANLPMRFDSDAMERRDLADTDWGRVPIPEGEHPRLPPSGRENLTHRIAVKADRNDLQNLPIGGDGDELTVSSVEVRPRVLLASSV